MIPSLFNKGKRQAWIHTNFHCFMEISHIFHNKYIFNDKKHFPSWNPVWMTCYVVTAVTFPLRPPRLAFAICGWRWQNDVHEIKYSVCVCVCERGLKGVKIQKISWGSLPPDPTRSLCLWRLLRKSVSRELKLETFSGRRRPDWQSNPGTEVAVASLQNSNIKIAVNLGGRHLGKLPKRKIWLHIKN